MIWRCEWAGINYTDEQRLGQLPDVLGAFVGYCLLAVIPYPLDRVKLRRAGREVL